METRSALFKTRRDETGNYVVTKTLIKSIIQNYEWYAGTFKWAANSELGSPIHIDNNHPPIIDPELLPEVKRIIHNAPKRPCRYQGVLPLAGLIHSFNPEGEVVPLEYAMTTGNTARYIYTWEYNRSLPGGRTWSIVHDLVDDPVCEFVLNRLVLPDYAEKVAEELEVNRQGALEAVARYEASKTRLEQEIKNLQKNFARVTLEENIVSIEQQIAQRREKLAGLAAEAESLIVGRQVMSEREIETYREFLSDLPALWGNADNELRNHFLHIVLQGVYVLRESTFYDVMILWYNGEQDFIRIHIPPRFWRRDKWTEEQEQYLRENYATASWHKLMIELGRKESAIKLRACQRGLERKEKASSGKNGVPKRRRCWNDIRRASSLMRK